MMGRRKLIPSLVLVMLPSRIIKILIKVNDGPRLNTIFQKREHRDRGRIQIAVDVEEGNGVRMGIAPLWERVTEPTLDEGGVWAHLGQPPFHIEVSGCDTVTEPVGW